MGFLEYEEEQAKARQLATLKQGGAPVPAGLPERGSNGESREKAGQRMGVGGRNVEIKRGASFDRAGWLAARSSRGSPQT